MNKIPNKTLTLIKKMNKAFREYPMLSDGDKIAVALSGGHDSLSLLHLLELRKTISPEKHDIIAIHVIGDTRGPKETPIHQPLIDWLDVNRYAYVVAPMQIAENEKLPMNCQRCTWNRRATIFKIANRLGCNKIAFGHHFDDMVETALLNLLYQGRMATMSPYDTYFEGHFALIRPLTHISKREIASFALMSNFPPAPPDCSRGEISKRKMVNEILKIADTDYRGMRRNIFRAAINCMKLEEKLKGNQQKINQFIEKEE
jgi:tRNA(Ile)-lysidine synthase TilS/MesJ